MQTRTPTHRKHGLGRESITVNLPTLILARMLEHCTETGSTRAAYITSVIEEDLDHQESMAGKGAVGSCRFQGAEPTAPATTLI